MKTPLLKILLILAIIPLLSACPATTNFYERADTSTEVDGGRKNQRKASTSAKPVKRLTIGGDINGAFTLETGPNGYAKLDVKPLDASQVVMQRIAVRDGKGNPLFDKAGNAVYDEIPLVAGLNHSRPTTSFLDGLSKLFRSIGSVIGTVAASITGASVAGDIAGAIPPTL